MDQLPVEIKIDDFWNPQLDALCFLTIPHQSCFLLYKCRIGEVIFTQRCFHDAKKFKRWTCVLQFCNQFMYLLQHSFHYVNSSVPWSFCSISVIPSCILSILFMNLKYKLIIFYKINLNRQKIGYFSRINKNIEKHTNVMLINTYPRFPPIFNIV